MNSLTQRLFEAALELGFELVGATPSQRPESFDDYTAWIEQGQQAGMSYLARNVNARSDPAFLLPDVKSLLLLGVPFVTVLRSDQRLRDLFYYKQDNGSEPNKTQAYLRVASYACGADYHDWIRKRLKKLGELHRQLTPNGRARGVVDTAPLLERQFAVNAGLGVIGKNTMLIHPKWGSRLFLAALLTTEELRYSTPSEEICTFNPCHHCDLCIQNCPNRAIARPFRLNAGKCLNYWTIEHHGEIPPTIQSILADRFFGCETCLDICPWNQQHSEQLKSGFLKRDEIQNLSGEEFRKRFAGTPLVRAKGNLSR